MLCILACQCNGHSSCVNQTAECKLPCNDLTEGRHCEQCIAGYYGNPVNGGNCTRKYKHNIPFSAMHTGFFTLRNPKLLFSVIFWTPPNGEARAWVKIIIKISFIDKYLLHFSKIKKNLYNILLLQFNILQRFFLKIKQICDFLSFFNWLTREDFVAPQLNVSFILILYHLS